MSPLRPSKLSTTSIEKTSFMNGYIQFLNKESTKGSSPSQVTSQLKLKDIVIKKLPKTKSDVELVKMERRKSISNVRRSPTKSSRKSPTKSLCIQSVTVPSADAEQNDTIAPLSMCDKNLRLCIEDVGSPVKLDFTETGTDTSQYMIFDNKTTITNTSQAFAKISHHSHHSADRKISQRPLVKNGDTALITNLSKPKQTILAPPILQPSKLKLNGDSLLLAGNGNLMATVATEKITLNSFASRPPTTTSSANQFTKPNGNAVIEVTNFLANSSIIKTK